MEFRTCTKDIARHICKALCNLALSILASTNLGQSHNLIFSKASISIKINQK